VQAMVEKQRPMRQPVPLLRSPPLPLSQYTWARPN
jgi:hypothetical protein